MASNTSILKQKSYGSSESSNWTKKLPSTSRFKSHESGEVIVDSWGFEELEEEDEINEEISLLNHQQLEEEERIRAKERDFHPTEFTNTLVSYPVKSNGHSKSGMSGGTQKKGGQLFSLPNIDKSEFDDDNAVTNWLRKSFYLLGIAAIPLLVYYITYSGITRYLGFRQSLSRFSDAKKPSFVSPINYSKKNTVISSNDEAKQLKKSYWIFRRLEDESEEPSSLLGHIDFDIYNEYTKTIPLSGNYNWSTIVEPYRLTWLEVQKPVHGLTYKWYVDGEYIGEGANVTNSFQSPEGEIQLLEVKGYLAGVQVSEGQKEVMCKYVRREIRALLAQDRVAFFQAVAIMQRVPTAVGQALYGKNYHSKDYFNRIHLYFGGAQDCDHWHTVSTHIHFFHTHILTDTTIFNDRVLVSLFPILHIHLCLKNHYKQLIQR